MAVEGPSAWVVGNVLDDDVARLVEDIVAIGILGDVGTRHQLHISTVGVLWVSLDGSIPLSSPLSEDPEVVAVEMHGVRDRSGIVDIKTYRAVGTKAVDVPLWGKVEVTLHYLRQDW